MYSGKQVRLPYAQIKIKLLSLFYYNVLRISLYNLNVLTFYLSLFFVIWNGVNVK